MAIQLKHANVNSGNWVTIKGSFGGYSIKRLNQINPIESNTWATDTTEWDIAESSRGGVENPVLTINAVIDIDNPLSGELDEQLLREFCRQNTGYYYLKVTLGENNTQIRDYYGNQDANGIKCELISVDQQYRPPSQAQKQHMYTVRMTFREVR